MEITDANVAGNVHGGVVMRLADTAAALAAIRHAEGLCVTVSVDEVSFLAPVHVGDVVTLRASVNDVGTTSLECGVRVEAENPISGRSVHAATAYFVFVALDERRAAPCRSPRSLSRPRSSGAASTPRSSVAPRGCSIRRRSPRTTPPHRPPPDGPPPPRGRMESTTPSGRTPMTTMFDGARGPVTRRRRGARVRPARMARRAGDRRRRTPPAHRPDLAREPPASRRLARRVR